MCVLGVAKVTSLTDDNTEEKDGPLTARSRSSLKHRILFWQTAILTVVVLIFGVAIYLQQRQSRLRDIDSELSAAVEVILARLQSVLDQSSGQSSSGLEDISSQQWSVPDTFSRRRLRHSYERPYFVIWNAADEVLLASDLAEDVPLISEVLHRGPADRTVRGRNDYREAWGFGPSGTTVLVGRHVGVDYRDLGELSLLLAVVGVFVLAIGFGGAWLLSQKAVQPIAEISAVAARLSETNLDERIDASRMDVEFEELSSTLNDAFRRLESAFAQQVKFTADASHELRTPLAVIRMHQDLALSKDRSADEYKRALETCARSTVRMTTLVEGLLELARLDAQPFVVNYAKARIDMLIREVVDDVSVLATHRNITVETRLVEAEMPVDSTRISQVILNLLTNAIAYSPDGGTVHAQLQDTGESFRVSVVDEGPGISPEDQVSVFDRFFRVEEGRSRQTGGSGLGLSICQAIIAAHGGALGVDSELGQGSRFWFSLPKNRESMRG